MRRALLMAAMGAGLRWNGVEALQIQMSATAKNTAATTQKILKRESAPSAVKKPAAVWFGDLGPGELPRGPHPTDLMNPPLEATDPYFHLRDLSDPDTQCFLGQCEAHATNAKELLAPLTATLAEEIVNAFEDCSPGSETGLPWSTVGAHRWAREIPEGAEFPVYYRHRIHTCLSDRAGNG